MSPSLSRILIWSALLLLFVGSGIAIAQGQHSGETTLPAQATAPALGTVVTSSGVFTTPTGTVMVTALGAQPTTITVTVGAQVVWVNGATTPLQVASSPFWGTQVYLPLVMQPGAATSADAAPAQTASPVGLLPMVNDWRSDPIAPGGHYRRVFAEAGVFRYYTSHSEGIAGIVAVVSDTLASTVYIEAAQGGVVTAGDATLQVPAGALAKDTAITVRRPISGSSLALDGMTAVALESEALELVEPLTLTLSYPEPIAEFDEQFMNVVAYNKATGAWEPQEILALDPAANTVSVLVEHFSWRLYYIDKPLYLTLEIPGKFLRPGDVLVRMQGYAPNCNGEAVWFPGHTGIYSTTVGTEEAIIESNSYENARDWGCGGWSGGVRKQTLRQFLDATCGFYMGARRKAGVTVAQQQSARDYAAARLGKGYLVVGQGNVQGNCYSCVGLVEAGYDHAGASIVPTAEEFPFITPLSQFQKTVPVSEIDVAVGESIQIPVKAIYKVSVPRGGDHYALLSTHPAVEGLPEGSTYTNGAFKWTPQNRDGGKRYTVKFRAEATVNGKQQNVTQDLTIHVGTTTPSPTPSALPTVPTLTPTVPVATATSTPTATPTTGPTPTAVIINVFDDFSRAAVGAFPPNWSLFGTQELTPTVQERGGTGAVYHVLDFPEVGWQYWDSFAIHNGVIAEAVYTVQAKLRFFNEVADRAGVTIAWDRSAWTRIDIQPNVYHNNIEFRSSYGGTVETLVPNLDIRAGVDYWLRAVVEDGGPNAGKVSVYWSTDSVAFTKILAVTGLTRVSGEAGVSTAGPHMPHTQFDDFRIQTGVP